MSELIKKIWRLKRKLFCTDLKPLALSPTAKCDANKLGKFTVSWLSETFKDNVISTQWEEDHVEIKQLNMPEMTGGVNPGDQRALYYITNRLQPSNVLEIGTHVGSSTIAFALATKGYMSNSGHVVTVDVRDVNDEKIRPWEDSQSPASPLALLSSLGVDNCVTFEIGTAITYLGKRDKETYDIIFLDGDHSAESVYQEIPLALKKLTKGGVIILHDLFPEGKPLWDTQPPLLGPWSAVARFKEENAPFKVIPLGELPWTTKLGSQITSLALVSAL